MRIAVVGSHSTGKTTLIQSFVTAHPELKFEIIPEVATEVIEAGYPLGKNGNVDSYIHYINRQLASEIEAKDRNFDILLADRTILDGAVHPKINKSLPRPYLTDDLIEIFFNILSFQKIYYDLYVYLPVEFPMAENVYRPKDENYREAIDREIARTLDTQGVKYITLSGNIDARCRLLYQYISTTGLKKGG